MTREERLNNPMGLKHSTDKFQGEITSLDPVFKQFIDASHGIRAGVKTLFTYFRDHGLNTIESIIGRWAPSVENSTAAYITAVAEGMGVQEDEIINLEEQDVTFGLTVEIIRHENGELPYPPEYVLAAVKSAYDS